MLTPLGVFGQFTLVQTGGTFRTDATNLARTANFYGQDELDLGVHFRSKINDGAYGNSSSWIGDEVYDEDQNVITDSSSTSFVGVTFDSGAVSVGSIAFGRDNLGDFTDRVPASYLVQYLTAFSGWVTYGSVSTTTSINPGVRHLYNLDTPLTEVWGIRVVTPTGLTYGSAIDELEVYATAAAIPEPSTYAALAGLGALGLAIWRRRQQRRA